MSKPAPESEEQFEAESQSIHMVCYKSISAPAGLSGECHRCSHHGAPRGPGGVAERAHRIQEEAPRTGGFDGAVPSEAAHEPFLAPAPAAEHMSRLGAEELRTFGPTEGEST